MGKRGKKADVEISTLIWIIIAVAFLVLGVILTIISKKQGVSIFDFIKDLIRFKK